MNRVSKGTPTGGQFATSAKGEASGVTLTEDAARHAALQSDLRDIVGEYERWGSAEIDELINTISDNADEQFEADDWADDVDSVAAPLRSQIEDEPYASTDDWQVVNSLENLAGRLRSGR